MSRTYWRGSGTLKAKQRNQWTWAKCNSPLGDYELHCDEETMKELKAYLEHVAKRRERE